MTNIEKLAFRSALLLQLQAAYPASLPDHTLCDGAKLSGYNVQEREVAAHLEYLCELGYVARFHSELSEGVTRSKLSAKGVGYLERNGF